MNLFEPVEYALRLNTDEQLEILEIDEGRADALQIPAIKESLSKLLSLCNPVTRLAVEEAKQGYSDRLESQLRTSPVAALLKIDKPECIDIVHCPLREKKYCITTEVAGKKKKFLPICWEYKAASRIIGYDRVLAMDLARHIVHAWNKGTYVLTITG